MAAVLACGPRAALSHLSAALLWGLWKGNERKIEISIEGRRAVRQPGVVIRRRTGLRDVDFARNQGLPVTSPICTLIDIAPLLGDAMLDRAINHADRLELVDPDGLRAVITEAPPRRGIGRLRRLLDQQTFTLTDSTLERLFLPLAASADLPRPLTQQTVNGFRVDFFWPGLGLVVETDGLRYHRTPAEQARDRLRDQAHTAAGLTPLRFTHAQVRYEAEYVTATLARTGTRLRLKP